MSTVHWTDSEIQIILVNVQTHTHEQLAEMLPGRSIKSIKSKCARLGVFRGSWHIPKDVQNPLVLTEVEKAYFAGHFDGEGTIGMRSNGKSFKLAIAVTNGYKPVLEKYQACFGGSVYQSRNGTNKTLWFWRLTGYYACLNFMDCVLPFVMEKREQLQVARDFAVKRIEASVTQPTDDIRQLGSDCHMKLQQLKKFDYFE